MLLKTRIHQTTEGAIMAVKPIPDGYHNVIPYLVVPEAASMIDFLKRAFGATEICRFTRPDGGVGHAEVRIGDSVVMLSGASEACKPMPAGIYLYVEDTDAAYQRALKAGASSLMEPADQFYGDRNAGVRDLAGNYWWIATHKEDVPSDEMQRRAEAHMKKQQQK
jgi:PhnB protein